MIFAHLFQAASNLLTDPSALESSISALERAISALESEIKAFDTSSWEYAGFVFTFLVFAGVLLELWVIRHEWREDMETWALSYFGVSRSPARPSLTKLRIEIASVLLIGLGIAGELAVGIKVASINLRLRGKESELRSNNSELRSKSDQLLAVVTQQAGEAKDNALIAKESAKAAGIDAGNAKTKSETVDHLAKHIDAELAQAEYLMSARRIENAEKLADELRKKFKGRNIALMSYRGDQEGWGLCAQLAYVAKSAEMKVFNQCGVEDFIIPGPGLENQSAVISPMEIAGPNVRETVDIGEMLVTIGRVPFGASSGQFNNMLMIFVGVKPPFRIGQVRGVKIPTKKQAKKQSAKP